MTTPVSIAGAQWRHRLADGSELVATIEGGAVVAVARSSSRVRKPMPGEDSAAPCDEWHRYRLAVEAVAAAFRAQTDGEHAGGAALDTVMAIAALPRTPAALRDVCEAVGAVQTSVSGAAP